MTPKVSNIASGAEGRAVKTAEDVSVRLAKIARVLPHRFTQASAGAAGLVGQRAPDAAPSDRIPWCWRHERRCDECWAVGVQCAGERLNKNDPTGDAATSSDRHREAMARWTRRVQAIDGMAGVLEDAMRKAQDDVWAQLRRIEKAVEHLRDDIDTYDDAAPTERAPTPKDLTSLREDNRISDPANHCRLCAQVPPPGQAKGHWLRDDGLRHTDLKGLLDNTMPLCSGHMRQCGILQRATTPEETAHYRDHGKWPGTRTGPQARPGAA